MKFAGYRTPRSCRADGSVGMPSPALRSSGRGTSPEAEARVFAVAGDHLARPERMMQTYVGRVMAGTRPGGQQRTTRTSRDSPKSVSWPCSVRRHFAVRNVPDGEVRLPAVRPYGSHELMRVSSIEGSCIFRFLSPRASGAIAGARRTVGSHTRNRGERRHVGSRLCSWRSVWCAFPESLVSGRARHAPVNPPRRARGQRFRAASRLALSSARVNPVVAGFFSCPPELPVRDVWGTASRLAAPSAGRGLPRPRLALHREAMRLRGGPTEIVQRNADGPSPSAPGSFTKRSASWLTMDQASWWTPMSRMPEGGHVWVTIRGAASGLRSSSVVTPSAKRRLETAGAGRAGLGGALQDIAERRQAGPAATYPLLKLRAQVPLPHRDRSRWSGGRGHLPTTCSSPGARTTVPADSPVAAARKPAACSKAWDQGGGPGAARTGRKGPCASGGR